MSKSITRKEVAEYCRSDMRKYYPSWWFRWQGNENRALEIPIAYLEHGFMIRTFGLLELGNIVLVALLLSTSPHSAILNARAATFAIACNKNKNKNMTAWRCRAFREHTPRTSTEMGWLVNATYLAYVPEEERLVRLSYHQFIISSILK